MKHCGYMDDANATCDSRATWTLNGVPLCAGHVLPAATELRHSHGMTRFTLQAYGASNGSVVRDDDDWGPDGIHVEVLEPEPVRARAVAGRKRGR